MDKKLNSEEVIRQIESLLEELKISLSSGKKISTVSSTPEAIKKDRKFIGLTGKVYELVAEGFFDEPKTISDLQKKLKDRAINKKTTDLSSPLTLLINKRVLDRSKPDKGSYNYFKR